MFLYVHCIKQFFTKRKEEPWTKMSFHSNKVDGLRPEKIWWPNSKNGPVQPVLLLFFLNLDIWIFRNEIFYFRPRASNHCCFTWFVTSSGQICWSMRIYTNFFKYTKQQVVVNNNKHKKKQESHLDIDESFCYRLCNELILLRLLVWLHAANTTKNKTAWCVME